MKWSPVLVILVFLIALTSCSRHAPEVDPVYRAEIEARASH